MQDAQISPKKITDRRLFMVGLKGERKGGREEGREGGRES
jgi:hypothetical protein